MLPGIKIRDIIKNIDERGYFAELLKNNWTDFLEDEPPQQISLSVSNPGVIRAWHHHSRGQIDHFIVLRGAMKIVAYDDTPASKTRGELTEIVASGERFQIVRVPGRYWHGTKTISTEPSVTIYAVSRMYDQVSPDEERRAWNDPSVIDPRTKQPYDWHKAPHK